MSNLTNKIKKREDEFILVSETLELISQVTNDNLDNVRKYLLYSGMTKHVPVYYKDEYLSFNRLLNDYCKPNFTSTYKALTEPLLGNEYFETKSLGDFKPIVEYDIFAYKRGCHYFAKKEVCGYKVDKRVLGLTPYRADLLLSKGTIEKFLIERENLSDQSKLAERTKLSIKNEQAISNNFKKPMTPQVTFKNNEDKIDESKKELAYEKPKSKEQPSQELAAANAKIADLDSQLTKAIAALKNISTDSNNLSNVEAQNIKQIAIKQFNRSLAIVLRDLDSQNKLRKGDIVDFIIPYMKDLAFILADQDDKKADNLTVSYDTLYDTHLQGLEFKTGRQSNDDKNKVNIDLLFKKQLPVTE
ncbi:hypothetical protein [Psychrobacter sp. DAB_AL62B]|uniref:hypothetical protein n=1 Tax=Psychrobacter sp. DAB_AL62B TaxID=1028420 RepID=UPI002380CAD5|nr:hypothetical protein [Psychrobacter sp. DAB_AL62B]MDE4455588.1 hypothetical protein [Psychrobacter sp. DAB_AL62B]